MSGFVWFVLGVLVGALWRWEYLGVAFGFAVTVVSGIVSFLGAIGTAALLIVTAMTFWAGQQEVGRGRAREVRHETHVGHPPELPK
jgi:hypothetical protein